MVSRTENAVAESCRTSEARGEYCGTNRPIRIWLVDDSENFRVLLAELLGAEPDFECSRQFSSAEAVLDALSSDIPPNVILLDIRMPGMGGLEAVRYIKALSADTRVLMLTTFYDSHAKAQALQDGASALMLKNYRIEDIAQHVRAACEAPANARLEVESAPTSSVCLDETVSSWPCRRAPEIGNGWKDSRGQDNSRPTNGHRTKSWRGASIRLVRGVRSLLGLEPYQTETAE